MTRAKHVPSRVEGTQSTPSDGHGLSSRTNARDLRKISPFGRNDNVFFLCAFASWRDKFSYRLQWREDATRLNYLDRALDGARADIQVPEPDFSHDLVAGHERDLAGVDARDFSLFAR